MNLYTVLKKGVRFTQLVGTFDTEDNACSVAQRAAQLDKNPYHWYEVIPYTLNEVPENSPEPYKDDFKDIEPIAAYQGRELI